MSDGVAPDLPSLLERSFACAVLVVHEDELGEDYFRLDNGMLGELFQKLINYRRRLALIVPDEGAHGQRVRELISEHRTHSHIRFFRSRQAATDWIGKISEEQT